MAFAKQNIRMMQIQLYSLINRQTIGLLFVIMRSNAYLCGLISETEPSPVNGKS